MREASCSGCPTVPAGAYFVDAVFVGYPNAFQAWNTVHDMVQKLLHLRKILPETCCIFELLKQNRWFESWENLSHSVLGELKNKMLKHSWNGSFAIRWNLFCWCIHTPAFVQCNKIKVAVHELRLQLKVSLCRKLKCKSTTLKSSRRPETPSW